MDDVNTCTQFEVNLNRAVDLGANIVFKRFSDLTPADP